jgi:hypothetical protein
MKWFHEMPLAVSNKSFNASQTVTPGCLNQRSSPEFAWGEHGQTIAKSMRE